MAETSQGQLQIVPLPGHSTLQPYGPHLRFGLLESCPGVGVLELARPSRLNAFGTELWTNFGPAVQALSSAEPVQAVLLCSQGPHFCAGIDTAYLAQMMQQLNQGTSCQGRVRERLRSNILALQQCFTSLEHCRWPVIAAVHGACIGGGVDLVTACDIRLCSQDATFCVKEVDLAITADLGTLQRLPRIVGHGVAMDLALTARTIGSSEALRVGLVTQVVSAPGQAAVLGEAVRLATQLAAKPPLASIGTKRVLLHTRDAAGGVAAGLEYVATHNAAFLLSDDLTQAVAAGKSKKSPAYSKL